MSNWDLMMPGMGLTAIGIAGLTISYAEIAHTFIDGMHALTGLTMFVGLIFLAVGILDGGISTSNKAKATTLVILSIAFGFGMFAFTLNTSSYTVTLAGILMGIAFPAIAIAYIASKYPVYLKPVGTIMALAAATGIIAWVGFGFVSPDTYLIPQEAVVVEPEEEAVDAPVFPIEILEGSDINGNPDYEPDVAVVPQGFRIEWTNADAVIHTVTSTEDVGETFDSSLMDAGAVYTLDTSELEVGEYDYFCLVHPWMSSLLIIEEPTEPVTVVIPAGAGLIQDDQIYYDPENIDVPVGTIVAWDNQDDVAHTVNPGTPDNPGDLFDSGLFSAGEVYQFAFTEAGTYDYYCLVHPWMVGTVNVE